MIQFAELFNDCLSRFRESPEFRILNKHRAGSESLSAQERQSIIDGVESTFAPLFDKIKADASSLTDSDLVFCVLSNLGIGATTIADCLTISPHTVRVRKHRLREKLPASWYDVFYGEVGYEEEAQVEVSHKSPLPFLGEIVECYRNFFNIKGRSPRNVYLCFLIFTGIVVLVNNTLDSQLYRLSYMACGKAVCGFFSILLHIISWIITFGVLIPMYTVTVRRLHDLNCTGWLALFFCGVPCVIVIICNFVCTFFNEVFFLKVEVTREFRCLVIEPLTFLNQKVLYTMYFVLFLVFSVRGTKGPNAYGR